MRRAAIILGGLAALGALTAVLLSLINDGAAQFEVAGERMVVAGNLTLLSTERIEVLAEQHPEITTVTLGEIDPASDPQAMMEKALLIRSLDLNTEVAPGVTLSPGAVLLYLGGVERSLAEGARLSVSDWQTPVGPAALLVADHPAHQERRRHMERLLGDAALYDFSVAAAPVGAAHILSADEIARFGLTTGETR
jgi:hypothetical protein